MANYVAAVLIVAAVALFVAAPLSGGFPRRRGATSRELELERLEHDRGLAVQGLRELEFDHEMGKLDELDYRDLKRSLEDRALAAMSAIAKLSGVGRAVERTALLARSAGRANSAKPVVNFCPQCGVPVGASHNYCACCGASLTVVAARVAARAE